jgi:hypothetical protein
VTAFSAVIPSEPFHAPVIPSEPFFGDEGSPKIQQHLDINTPFVLSLSKDRFMIYTQ